MNEKLFREKLIAMNVLLFMNKNKIKITKIISYKSITISNIVRKRMKQIPT